MVLVERKGLGPVYVAVPEQLGDPGIGVAVWEEFDLAHSGMPAKVIPGFSLAPSPLGRNLLASEFPPTGSGFARTEEPVKARARTGSPKRPRISLEMIQFL
jgi:hypothetical protein